jgi:hypothetical protein
MDGEELAAVSVMGVLVIVEVMITPESGVFGVLQPVGESPAGETSELCLR